MYLLRQTKDQIHNMMILFNFLYLHLHTKFAYQLTYFEIFILSKQIKLIWYLSVHKV